MDDNRYAPPKSAVADLPVADATDIRPVQVIYAVKLWAVSYIVGLLVLAANWDYYSKLQPISSLIFGQVLSLALVGWLYYKIYVGRNWARITWLVLVIFGGAMTLSATVRNMVSEMPFAAKAHMLIAVGIDGVILWLLFFSPGRTWFRRRKNIEDLKLMSNKTIEPTR
ncbi:MAG TPA: hypothetical protein VET48_14065 [Steroidobacteraceae bacterium]|nr:hypothetical protein [Steroidobacteraceae bacterium]